MSDSQASVIIPVYNSEDCLNELTVRLIDVLDNLDKTYEIVMVNDCSPDNSWRKITELCKMYDKLKGINLRKNRKYPLLKEFYYRNDPVVQAYEIES
jgi:glycosyltransferase involved in cell wall biosynthesis